MPDCESSITPNIPGRGPLDAPFLIVGQSPNAREDLAGELLLGPEAKALQAMLADAGYKPEEYRYTTAVRCLASADYTTIEAHRAQLIEEIQLVKPRVIIALGDAALRSLTKQTGMSGRRGKSLKLHNDFGYDGAEVWPTYNPKYVLSRPQARNVVVSDFSRARKAVYAEPEDIAWEFFDPKTLAHKWQFLDAPVAYDIETDYWINKGNNIIQIAATNKYGTLVTRDHIPEMLQAIQGGYPILSLNGWAFDDKLTGVTSDYDVMALAYIDDETQPLGLESLAVKYLGVPGWKDARLGVDPDSDEFAAYNARDAFYTHRLYTTLRERVGERIKLVDRIIRPAKIALGHASKRGLYISGDAVANARTHYAERLSKLVTWLRAKTGQEGLNPNATTQVAAALLGEGHKLPPTKEGKPSTAAAVLAGLKQTPLVKGLRATRKAQKALTFVKQYEAIVEDIYGDGRTHNDYTLLRTLTGRSSARNLNIQQLPRDPIMRSFFDAPPGKELWYVDYSSIEFRLAAWVAGEQSILDRYAHDPNWDPHTFFAALFYDILEEQVTPDQRQIAKSANYGLLFKAQVPTLIEYAQKMGLKLSVPVATALRSKWHATFPAFRGWYKGTENAILKDGYIETVTGRRRHFGDPALLYGGTLAAAVREGVNVQVQGPAADIAMLGFVECDTAGYPFNGFFHDANTFEFDAGTGEQHIEHITHLMTVEPLRILREEFGIDITVPLTVDAKKVSK